MDEKLNQKLLSYYCDCLLNRYIYSKDLRTLINERNILFEDWFLECMEFNVEYNEEFQVYDVREKNNCYEMISGVLFNAIKNEDLETVDKCNFLVRTLNCSKSDNYYDYMIGEFIYSSANPKRAGKIVGADLLDFDDFEQYFDFASKTAGYLLGNYDSCVPEVLTLNSYVIHSLVEIIKRMPEILKDSKSLQRIRNVLDINKFKFDNNRKLKSDYYLINKENNDTIKYLKRLVKSL